MNEQNAARFLGYTAGSLVLGGILLAVQVVAVVFAFDIFTDYEINFWEAPLLTVGANFFLSKLGGK